MLPGRSPVLATTQVAPPRTSRATSARRRRRRVVEVTSPPPARARPRRRPRRTTCPSTAAPGPRLAPGRTSSARRGLWLRRSAARPLANAPGRGARTRRWSCRGSPRPSPGRRDSPTSALYLHRSASLKRPSRARRSASSRHRAGVRSSTVSLTTPGEARGRTRPGWQPSLQAEVDDGPGEHHERSQDHIARPGPSQEARQVERRKAGTEPVKGLCRRLSRERNWGSERMRAAARRSSAAWRTGAREVPGGAGSRLGELNQGWQPSPPGRGPPGVCVGRSRAASPAW